MSQVDALRDLLETLEEKGCEDDHFIAPVAKVHTDPPQWKYECQTCGNEAMIDRPIKLGEL